GDARDGRVSVAELTAFVQAGVDRWAVRNRGRRQVPTLLGSGGDFVVANVNGSAPSEPAAAPPEANRCDLVDVDFWQARDEGLESGDFRLDPGRFQKAQAGVLQAECRREWPLSTFFSRKGTPLYRRFGIGSDWEFRQRAIPLEAGKTLDRLRRDLDQQLAAAKPGDADRIKARFIQEVRDQNGDAP